MADTSYCQTTRDSFSGVIQKPPLSDKLLQKPPFQFLHDVICATLKSTGFMEGLFSPEELDKNSMKDKNVKTEFLQKVIDVVQFGTEQKLEVKIGKILAGQEPEKTNRLLQNLAAAAKTCSKEGNSAIVAKVKAGEKFDLASSGGSAGSNKENRTEEKPAPKMSKSRDSSKDTKPDEKRRSSTSKEKGKEKDKEKDKKSSKDSSEKRSSSKDAKKERSDKTSSKEKSDKTSSKEKFDKTSSKEKSDKTPSKEKSDKTSSKEKSKDSKKDSSRKDKDKEKPKKDKDKEDKRKDKDKKKDKENPKKEKPTAADPEPQIPVENGITVPDEVADEIENESSPVHRLEKRESISHSAPTEPPSEPEPAAVPERAAHSARPPSAMGRPGTAMGRPGTASSRRAPPRIKRKELGEIEQKQIDSAKEVGETANLIISDEQADTKEEENFLVEEEPAMASIDFANGGVDEGIGADADELDAEDHGVLVRKILETKKELESGLQHEKSDRLTMVVFDEKEREKTRKETSKLQDFIQKLTRTTHPLGRLLDYLQEDIDSMVKEIEQWRTEYRQNASKLRQTHGLAYSDSNTLKSKLIELDSQILETRDAIAATRSKILTSDAQTDNLVQALGR